jgi:hypothetical protein
MSNEMKHYGILGMRWGKRMASASRYETARRSGMSKKDARSKIETENMTTAKAVSNHASTFTKEGINITKSIGNARSAHNKEDLSKLSDSELREKINRMNMEQQYSTLSSSKVSNGEVYARSMLETTGSVLAIGGSALAIAVAIKELKG